MARKAKHRRGTWWRALLIVGLGLCGLVVAAPLALDTPWAREQLRQQLNQLLGSLFQGRISIDRLAHVGLWGVRGVDARVFDARGQQVIRVQGLTALASLPKLAVQLLAHADAPQLDIDWVQIDHADVTLREHQELGVTLADTFLPREEAPATTSQPSGGGLRLSIGRIGFGRVWAHGRVAGSPPLDADLLDLRASLSQSEALGLELELERATLVTRALPLGADPRGSVSGRLEVPQAEARPMRMEATLDGSALGSPLELEASWVGDALFARARLPRLPAARLNQQLPGLALDSEVALEVQVDGELPELDFQAEISTSAAKLSARGQAVVADGLELSTELVAEHVNLAAALADAPASDLSLNTSAVLFETDAGRYQGAYRLDVEPGRLAGQATPAAWLAGQLSLDADEPAGLRSAGRLALAEPGAAITGEYHVALPEQGAGRIAVALRADLEQPARLRAFGVRTSGRLSLDAELEPGSRQLSAKTQLSLGRLEYRELTARNVELRARASGNLAEPQLQAATTLDLLSGRVHADLRRSARETKLELFAADLDVLRLARTFDTPLPLEQGTLGLDLELSGPAHGSVYRLNGDARLDLGKVGSVRVEAHDFELPSAGFGGRSPAALRGRVDASGKLDLSQVSQIFTLAQLPIERTTGKLRFELSAQNERGDGQGLELSALLETTGLRVIQQREALTQPSTTAEARASTPLALEGIDLRLSAHSRPSSGEAVGTLILRDAGGTLAELQAEARIGQLWSSGPSSVQALQNMPLKASLHVPTRRLGSLPPLLRPPVMRGRIALDADFTGSIAEPSANVALQLQSLRASGSKEPLDVQTKLSYAPSAGRLEAQAQISRTHARVLELEADWQGDLRRAAELGRVESVLQGSAKATLSELPLDVVPDLIDRQVLGRLSGQLELRDWGNNARVDAHFGSTSLSVGKVAIPNFDLRAKSDDSKLVAELSLDAAGGGSTRASLDAAMRWGRAALPQLGQQGVAKLTTRGFELATLTPLLGAYVSELGGTLDADTELDVSAGATQVKGQAKLRRGVLQVPAIGQRFSDIEAQVAVHDNQFTLEKLVARGTTGRITVTGAAGLDGFQLRSAKARAEIAEREQLPITLEGQVLGDAWGSVALDYQSPAQGARKLRIHVPSFHLAAPEDGGSGLQSLDESQDIRVGVRRGDGKFVLLAVQPLEPGGEQESSSAVAPAQPLEIEVQLDDIAVERGRAVKAQLSGKLAISSAAETRVTGRIEVRGGKLDVQGKNFEIERGVITFSGPDPGNPTITATARWDAPDYSVYADYVGDVENGRIKLRSEPPLTQDEIASLLLFGSPEGSAGSNDPNAAALAVSVAGDSATRGLNQALDDFTNLDVSARIDTTTGSARPELVFQASPRVSAKVTRALGAPAAGESPDRTFLTLELRLKRAWALSGLIGDRGASALDLIWRRRY